MMMMMLEEEEQGKGNDLLMIIFAVLRPLQFCSETCGIIGVNFPVLIDMN